MSQRMAFVLAGGITAFMLVLLGGVIFTVRLSDNIQARSLTQPVQAAPEQQAANYKSTTALTTDHAAQIALNMAPGARLTVTPDLVNVEGTVAYEVTLDRGLVYVDANTGRVLSSTLTALPGTNPRGGQSFEREHEGGERD